MLVELANDAFRKRESPMSVMSWLLEGDPRSVGNSCAIL